MSYQYKRADIYVVVCDACGEFSWVSDRRWRAMPQGSESAPIHLCQACQPQALWCQAHQQYHLPEVLHRHACSDCGGLFTSAARDQLTSYPSCRRAAGAAAPPAAWPSGERRRSLLDRLFAPLR